jgi:uncharacterized linocin/CFP29 family protein
MNHLLRELAPVPDAAWHEIEAEARRALSHFLTARRLVDFAGPLGWQHDSLPSGRVEDVADSFPGVRARARAAHPFIELRVDFEVDRAALDALELGAEGIDLDDVREAARRLAQAEDGIALGDAVVGRVKGLGAASPHPPVAIGDDARNVPDAVARAIQTLRDVGVGGPYAVALGSNTYTAVVETTEMGGYPVLEHIRLISGGPVLWSPTVNGGIVCSTRGGDARLTVGQDAAIGYRDHDESVVHLYLEESLAFEVLAPEAAVRLTER